jgi:ribokinase
VTLGEYGALACDSDGPLHLPAASVMVRDATGAGDAFCGAFAHAWQRRETLRQAMERGIQAGARACTWIGAQAAR